MIHPVGKLEVKLVDDCPHVVGAPLSHRRHKNRDNPEKHLLNFPRLHSQSINHKSSNLKTMETPVMTAKSMNQNQRTT